MNDEELLEMAWHYRDSANPWKSGTKVGCAIQAEGGCIVGGFNIEGLWMTSIHAEVVAITRLAEIGQKGVNVAIVAETEQFTPCGACIDWLVQFCTSDCDIIIQNKHKDITKYKLKDLYPNYPKQ